MVEPIIRLAKAISALRCSRGACTPVITAATIHRIWREMVRDGAALDQRIGKADVLVISGAVAQRFSDLLLRAKRLRFIQSIGAGTQFSREALKQHDVRLPSARGVN